MLTSVVCSLGAGERGGPCVGYQVTPALCGLCVKVCLPSIQAVRALYFVYYSLFFCGHQHGSNFGLGSGLLAHCWTWGGGLVLARGLFVFGMDRASAAVLALERGMRVADQVLAQEELSGGRACRKRLHGAEGVCFRRRPRLGNASLTSQ